MFMVKNGRFLKGVWSGCRRPKSVRKLEVDCKDVSASIITPREKVRGQTDASRPARLVTAMNEVTRPQVQRPPRVPAGLPQPGHRVDVGEE